MASAKKGVKSSRAKQPKQIGTAKAKTPKQSAEPKAKKLAAARAHVIRARTADKLDRSSRANAPVAAASSARSGAKPAARKKGAAPLRARRAAAGNDKKAMAAARAKTTRSTTTAAGRRASAKAVASGTSRQIAVRIEPKATGTPAPGKRTLSQEPVRRVAAKLAAAGGKAVGAPNPGAQKLAAKAAAAAILALKRKSPATGKAAGQGGLLSAGQDHANSSRPNVAVEERAPAVKGSVKGASAAPGGGEDENTATPMRAGEGLVGAASQGNLKGSGKPFVAAVPQTSSLGRPDKPAKALATVQPKYNKPMLPGQSVVPAQKPARTANLPRPPFKLGEYVVYPSHGVGQIIAIEEQEVAGFTLELFVLSFAKDKMTLKVPISKAVTVGMRKVADSGVVKMALDTLAGRARIKRTMWSRRAQEYEAKINSGDLNAIAEVVRDLYRSDTQPEQSYSERQLYEAALDRMMREIVVVQKLTETEALKVIEAHLQKGPRRGKVEETEVDEPDIEEAA